MDTFVKHHEDELGFVLRSCDIWNFLFQERTRKDR